MIRIGIAGVGFMGMIHYLAARNVRGAKVSAIATRNAKRRAGDWTDIQGNFGPRGQKEDLTGVAAFSTIEEMAQSDAVDLVDVCLPNDQHCHAAVTALEAGKHVLVEKAVAMNLEEADRMIAAAKKADRYLLVAHVLPFFSDFRFALETILSGKFGKVKAAHFRRHISPPEWSADIADLQKSGGPVVDLHIHDTHFVGLACGVPKKVFSRGILRDGVPVYVSTQYLYDDPNLVVSATSGAISQPGRPFTHGFEIYLDEATLFYEAGGPVVLYTKHGKQEPTLGSSDPVDAFTAELQYAVDAITHQGPAPLLSAELARDALALCLKESESVRIGRAVEV